MQEHETFEGKCDKHGTYTGTVRKLFGREIRTSCPVCTQERVELEKQEQERARRQENARHYLQSANIPERFKGKSLDAFIATSQDQQNAVEVVKEYLDEWSGHLKNGDSLVFLGRQGTGKTHLSCVIATELCHRGYGAMYTKASDIIRRIKSTYNRDSLETESDVYRALKQPDLLIIDEVGRQLGTDAEKMYLFEVINERYEACKPMILISNLHGAELKNYITEAGFDRLKEIGKSVIFTCESMRGRLKSGA